MTATKKRTIPAKWRKLFALLPGYDPVATAAPGQYFDVDDAELACAFFPECLQHIEGRFAGQPFVLGEWESAIVGCVFGWKRADGTRRYRTVLLGVPRGNGKTPLSAGLCDYLLFCDGEAGAQIYGAAADALQAGLLFRHAKGMVERNPKLDSRCDIYIGSKSLVLKDDHNSVYRVVSSDAAGKHGFSPHAVLADELHAWQGRELMEAFDTAFAKRGRRQPLMVMITTRDYDGRESVCNEKWDYAERVRDGIVADDSFLPVIYAAPDDADWTDEKVWERCNPNIDVSVDRESLRRFCEVAKVTPTKEAEFKRLHLNMRTDSANPWMSLVTWDTCKGEIDRGQLVSAECIGGIDLSSTEDITAFVVVFPNVGGRCVVIPHFFIPETAARERENTDRVPYRVWEKQGLITMTPGASVDYDFVRAKILETANVYNLRSIGADRHNAQQLCTQLVADGFDVVYIAQSITILNAPTKEFERLAIARELLHDGNPILRWMVANACTRTDANTNICLSKRNSTARIDGLAATVTALAVRLAGPGPSKYEREGLVVI